MTFGWYCITLVFCLILQCGLIFYHILRSKLHYSSNKAFSCSLKKLRLTTIINITPIIYSTLAVIYFLVNIGICIYVKWTLFSCKFKILSEVTLSGLGKLCIHLFVCVRARIPYYKFSNERAKYTYIIGLILFCGSDFIWIIHVLSFANTKFEIIKKDIRSPHGCNMYHFPDSSSIWYGMNDFITCIYAMIIFIYPLWKITDQDISEYSVSKVNSVSVIRRNRSSSRSRSRSGSNSSNSTLRNDTELIRKSINRVIKWNTIAILATMGQVIFLIITGDANDYLFAIERVFIGFCTIMQFTPLKYNLINNKCLFITCKYINCKYMDQTNDLEKEIEINTSPNDKPIRNPKMSTNVSSFTHSSGNTRNDTTIETPHEHNNSNVTTPKSNIIFITTDNSKSSASEN